MQVNSGPVSLLTVELPDPHGFGRVVRDENGDVRAIVEEGRGHPGAKGDPGAKCQRLLLQRGLAVAGAAAHQVSPKGEYYLTDIVEIAVQDGLVVQAYQTPDATEAVGINTRVHLAEASAILRQRINEAWMLAGVSMLQPGSVFIDETVTISDSPVCPNC